MSPSELRASLSLASIFGLRLFGMFIILPVFALYARERPGWSLTLVGIALGAYGITQALLQLPFGWISDRRGRKPVMYFGQALQIGLAREPVPDLQIMQELAAQDFGDGPFRQPVMLALEFRFDGGQPLQHDRPDRPAFLAVVRDQLRHFVGRCRRAGTLVADQRHVTAKNAYPMMRLTPRYVFTSSWIAISCSVPVAMLPPTPV